MSGTDLKQRLAAILAADVAGYSRLMAADERGTVGALDAARRVFRSGIEANQGRVIDMAGDSVLAVFETAAGAVQAALSIQKEIDLSGENVPGERRMRFRIGIHLGDVIEKGDGTVYGDGVNIAARLEGLAEPGGITVSDSVRIAVKGKVAAGFEDQGEQQVKNIPDPVRAHRVRPEGSAAAAPAAGEADLPLPDKPSIAVLPFNNMSGDAEQEYFADGITEDIITELSRISGMLVIARNSTFVFKKQAVDVKEVARRLGVRHVLEGSVRKAGKRVRISAQLIDATTGGHCWAERFDRDLEDIFAVQDEVTQRIVAELKVKLTPAERSGRAPRGKVNPEAYDYMMRARACLMQFAPEAANEARGLIQRALEIDPGFATAYALLALLHSTEYVNGWTQAPDHVAQGMTFARRALELDAEDPVAHQAMAVIALWQKDYGAAEQAARRATELAPSYSGGFISVGQVLDFTGQHGAAIEAFEQALRLDPGFDLILHFIGRAQLGMGRHAEAEQSFKRRLIRNPHSDMTRAYLASLYGATGRADEARRLWAELMEINPKFSVEHLRRVLPYKDPAWFESFAGGLRQAGLVAGAA